MARWNKSQVEPIPEGYFVITKPQTTLSGLKRWIKHFKDKGIKTVVVRNERGAYLLCREGTELISEDGLRSRKYSQVNKNGIHETTQKESCEVQSGRTDKND